MIRLELPFPPPLSACFANFTYRAKASGRWTSRRIETTRYKTWQAQAHRMVDKQRAALVEQMQLSDRNGVLMPGEVAVMVRLVAPDKRERDAGNVDKAVGDILVKARIITNDSNRYIKRLTYAWAEHGCPCVAFVKPIEGDGA